MKKTIALRISKDGGVTVEANGFAGEECREATKSYVERIGAVTSETLKPEFELAPETAGAAEKERLCESS